MTDQTIPAGLTPEDAKKAREWALHALNKPGASTTAEKAVARVVIRTVPEPRPTMADMTSEEQAACRWMQCDAGPYGRRGLIIKVKYWSVYVVDKETGAYSNYTPDLVTARPDLPRMEWNGTEKVEDENALKIGDEIESADDPRLAALPVGSILLDRDRKTATNEWGDWTGEGYKPIPSQGAEFGPWKVLHIPKEADQ